jgi:hypothetical protein
MQDLPMLRIHNEGGLHPTTWNSFRIWGPVQNQRFDHHPVLPGPESAADQPPYAVMYAVATQHPRVVNPLAVAVVECCEDRVLDIHSNAPHLAVWAPTRALRLLDLSTNNDWLARAGGTLALTSGPHEVARQWSRAIHATFPDVDGLVWNSNVLPQGLSAVLYERAGDALPRHVTLRRALADLTLQPALASIAQRYNCTLI